MVSISKQLIGNMYDLEEISGSLQRSINFGAEAEAIIKSILWKHCGVTAIQLLALFLVLPGAVVHADSLQQRICSAAIRLLVQAADWHAPPAADCGSTLKSAASSVSKCVRPAPAAIYRLQPVRKSGVKHYRDTRRIFHDSARQIVQRLRFGSGGKHRVTAAPYVQPATQQ